MPDVTSDPTTVSMMYHPCDKLSINISDDITFGGGDVIAKLG